MDSIALEAFDAKTRRELFEDLSISPARLVDLGGFESFVFERRDRDTILRVTHVGHRSLEMVTAELQWIEFLARQGAAVSPPVRQADGRLAIRWRDFVVCEFERAKGGLITEQDWGPALFKKWGRCIGELHRLAGEYVPADPAYVRPDCSVDENFDLEFLAPAEQPVIQQRASEYRARFMAQSRTDDNFGLIHCDAHAGNFFIDNGNLTFFDFDDACYCWFAYDIATILFSAVLQSWLEDSEQAREKAAREFLPVFLDGYSATHTLPSGLLSHLPLGLKFREICLYGVINKYLPIDQWDWYPTRFMAGRRERIESDQPYLSLDFL